MKMPRKDYKKYFARDREGNYAGTEPEREWSREELDRDFGQYQDMPLRSVPGAQEFGEGANQEAAVGRSMSAGQGGGPVGVRAAGVCLV